MLSLTTHYCTYTDALEMLRSEWEAQRWTSHHQATAFALGSMSRKSPSQTRALAETIRQFIEEKGVSGVQGIYLSTLVRIIKQYVSTVDMIKFVRKPTGASIFSSGAQYSGYSYMPPIILKAARDAELMGAWGKGSQNADSLAGAAEPITGPGETDGTGVAFTLGVAESLLTADQVAELAAILAPHLEVLARSRSSPVEVSKPRIIVEGYENDTLQLWAFSWSAEAVVESFVSYLASAGDLEEPFNYRTGPILGVVRSPALRPWISRPELVSLFENEVVGCYRLASIYHFGGAWGPQFIEGAMQRIADEDAAGDLCIGAIVSCAKEGHEGVSKNLGIQPSHRTRSLKYVTANANEAGSAMILPTADRVCDLVVANVAAHKEAMSYAQVTDVGNYGYIKLVTITTLASEVSPEMGGWGSETGVHGATPYGPPCYSCPEPIMLII